MTEPRFFDCACGKHSAALAAFALLGAAVLAIAPRGPVALLAAALLVLATVVGFIVAVGLATRQGGLHVVGMLLALPVLGGAYLAALAVISGRGAAIAAPLVGLALVACWLALRGPAEQPHQPA